MTREEQKAHRKPMLHSHCWVWEPRCFFSTHHYGNDATALLQCCLPLSSVPGHDTASAQPRCTSAVSPAAPIHRRSGTCQLSPLLIVTQPVLQSQPFTFKPCTLLPWGPPPNHSLASPASPGSKAAELSVWHDSNFHGSRRRWHKRLLQEEGLAAQTGGGGCRSLTTIVSTTAGATPNICKLVTGTLCTDCLFCWGLNQLGSALVKRVHTFMDTDGKRPAERSSIWPSFRTTSLSPAMVPMAPCKYKWNQILLGRKSLCCGLFEITNQMLEQEQLQRNLKLAFSHSPTPLRASGI